MPAFIAMSAALGVASACLPSTVPDAAPREADALGAHLVRLSVEAHGGVAAWRRAETLEARYREAWWEPFAWMGQSPWADNAVDARMTLWLHDARAEFRFPGGAWTWNGQDITREPGAPRGGNPRYALPRTHYLLLLPFKLMDPGVHARWLGRVSVDGAEMDRLYVTFAEGTGDSPRDRLWVDLDARTHVLRRVFLVVTAYHPLAFGEVLFERPVNVAGLRLHAVVRARYPFAGAWLPLHTSVLEQVTVRSR